MARIVRGGLIQCANPINDESVPVKKIQQAALEAHTRRLWTKCGARLGQ